MPPCPAHRPGAPIVRRVRLALALCCVLGCSNETAPPPTAGPPSGEATPLVREGPPGARWDVVEVLREGVDARARFHPSDGGGTARLERDEQTPPYARVGTPERFRLIYEAGPLGIATGGAVLLQVSPYWGWSTPQVDYPSLPGYTVIRTVPDTLRVRAETAGEGLLSITITGRALAPGDRLEIDYGAETGAALPDRYAERASTFWFGVDGDGDGVRKLIVDSPTIDVRAAAVARLRVTVPSVVRPGEAFPVRLALLDGADNAGVEASGPVHFVTTPTGLELPERAVFRDADRGVVRVEGRARTAGTYRLHVRFEEIEAWSNPLIVAESGPRILWGDLHGHSNFSDGTGRPDEYFRYARDVSGLDVVSLTDHDHWGMEPLVESPDHWQEIQAQTKRFHDPGRFVTLLGFEWTNWIFGHRHVLFFEDTGFLVDSVDEKTDEPGELWEALDPETTMTVAHHPAGGPVPIDWTIPPDPRFETLVEIVSVHGSSEAADSPGLIRNAREGHFARDALDRGYRLGFVGSGDRHDGHPGTFERDPVNGGVAAILAEERTRPSVLRALRERRVYATNGPRIVLRAALGGTGMGGTHSLGRLGTEASLYVEVIGTAPLEHIDLIRSGVVYDRLDLPEGEREARVHRPLEGLREGEYLYVRVVQVDGGAAWSSPIFVDAS